MNNIINITSNFGYGYSFAKNYSETKNIAHGGNHLTASFNQSACVVIALQSISQFSENISNTPLRISTNIISRFIAPIFSGAFLYITSLYRTYVYTGKFNDQSIRDKINQFQIIISTYCKDQPKIKWAANAGLKLASKVNDFFDNNKGLINKIGKHAHNAAVGVMILSSAALISTGSSGLALAMAFPVVYEVLDSYNFVPHRVALVAEKIFPKIATLALILGGGVLGLITLTVEICKLLALSRNVTILN